MQNCGESERFTAWSFEFISARRYLLWFAVAGQLHSGSGQVGSVDEGQESRTGSSSEHILLILRSLIAPHLWRQREEEEEEWRQQLTKHQASLKMSRVQRRNKTLVKCFSTKSLSVGNRSSLVAMETPGTFTQLLTQMLRDKSSVGPKHFHWGWRWTVTTLPTVTLDSVFEDKWIIASFHLFCWRALNILYT